MTFLPEKLENFLWLRSQNSKETKHFILSSYSSVARVLGSQVFLAGDFSFEGFWLPFSRKINFSIFNWISWRPVKKSRSIKTLIYWESKYSVGWRWINLFKAIDLTAFDDRSICEYAVFLPLSFVVWNYTKEKTISVSLI